MSDPRAALEDGIVLGAGFEQLVAGSDDTLAVTQRLEGPVFAFSFDFFLAWGEVAETRAARGGGVFGPGALVHGGTGAGVLRLFVAWDWGCGLEGGDGLAGAFAEVSGRLGGCRGVVVGGRLGEVVGADCW